jgi:CRP-like cAMP-binding protein
LLALLRLRSHGAPARRSMLSPSDPEPDTPLGLSQADTSMDERSLLLERGAWLRCVPPFTGLSTAEAALLAARFQQIEVSAGYVIACQGEGADALFVVLEGHAEVRLAVGSQSRYLGSLGPGQCCGQVSVLPDGQHPAHVTATSDMTLLCLAKDDHATCLGQLPDVAALLGQEALRLLADVDQHRREQAAVNACGCGEDCACDHDHDHESEPASPTPADAAPENCHQGGDLS